MQTVRAIKYKQIGQKKLVKILYSDTQVPLWNLCIETSSLLIPCCAVHLSTTATAWWWWWYFYVFKYFFVFVSSSYHHYKRRRSYFSSFSATTTITTTIIIIIVPSSSSFLHHFIIISQHIIKLLLSFFFLLFNAAAVSQWTARFIHGRVASLTILNITPCWNRIDRPTRKTQERTRVNQSKSITLLIFAKASGGTTVQP